MNTRTNVQQKQSKYRYFITKWSEERKAFAPEPYPVYANSDEDLMSIYNSIGCKVKIVKREDAATGDASEQRELGDIVSAVNSAETGISSDIKQVTSAVGNIRCEVSVEHEPKYYSVGDNKFKVMPDGSLFVEKWVPNDDDGLKIRIINSATGKKYSLQGKTVEILRWVKVENENNMKVENENNI